MPASIDLLGRGYIDDTTESGVIGTRPRGGMVMIPFKQQATVLTTGGNASYAPVFVTDRAENPDGSGTGISIGQASGAGYSLVTFPFEGQRLGIRWMADTITSCDFSVGVDGEYVRVKGSDTLSALNGTTTIDIWSARLTHDNLAPGLHYCEIAVPAPAAGTRNLVLHGYLGDQYLGYRPLKPRNQVLTPVAVPTVDTQVSLINSGGTSVAALRQLTSISRIAYTNTNAFPAKVTIKANSTVIAQIILAGGETEYWPRANEDLVAWGNGAGSSAGASTSLSLTHSASAAGVNCVVVGGN